MARTRQPQTQSEPHLPISRRVERSFSGMVSAADQHDIPPGASVLQVNIIPRRAGELSVRGGLAILKFDD